MTLLLHLGLTSAEYFPKSWLERLSFFAYVLPVWLNFDFQMVSSSSVAVPSSYWTGLMAGLCVCSGAQSCLILCHPMDYSPPGSGSSVHGISQARILKGFAVSSSKGSFWPRDWTHVSCVSCIGRWILYHSATWETPEILLLHLE